MYNPSDQTARPHVQDERRWKVRCCHSALTIHPKLSLADRHNSTTLDGYGYLSNIEYPMGLGISMKVYPRTGTYIRARFFLSIETRSTVAKLDGSSPLPLRGLQTPRRLTSHTKDYPVASRSKRMKFSSI